MSVGTGGTDYRCYLQQKPKDIAVASIFSIRLMK